MTRYAVFTPIYEVAEGPSAYVPDDVRLTEPTCDYLEVEAPTARKAKILAVREWTRLHRLNWREVRWVADQRGDGHSPFTGIKAERLEEMP